MGILLDNALCFRNDWIKPKRNEKKRTISVIIPVFYPEHLEQVIFHLQQIKGFKDIILVDDSGQFRQSDYNFIAQYNNVKVVYHNKNLGRSCARNTGASYSESDVLVFIDQDMFLNPLFFERLNEYYTSNNSLLFLGCRDTVDFDSIPTYKDWLEPDISKEWRMKNQVLQEFVDLTVIGEGGVNNNCRLNETISIYKMTDGLRKMGVKKEKTLGFWDLPSMVVSHSMGILKKDFYAIGGFPEWIKGWGGEDTVLGFCACAAHIPIYLSELSSYQAAHIPYSGSEENKINELRENIYQYRKWALTADEFPKFLMNSNIKRSRVYHL